MSWPSWNSDTRLPLLLLSPSFQDGMATAGMRRRGGDAAARSDQHRERDGGALSDRVEPVLTGSDQVKDPFGSDQFCQRGVQRGI
jgi:hypothetical protein